MTEPTALPSDQGSAPPSSGPAAVPDPPVARTVRLRVAGVDLDLDFGPGHEDLAREVDGLWSGHLGRPETRDPQPAEDGTLRRTYVVPPREEELGLAVAELVAPVAGEASRGLLTRPDAMILAPGPQAAYAVSGDLTRAVIGRLLGEAILLHAGVVEHPRLGVLALVGASGAGKSTATLELGRGGVYLSDELAILDPVSHAVTAFPKPVSRVLGEDGGKQDIALAALGLRAGTGSAAPGTVVLLDRVRDGEASLSRVPLAEALLAIIEQSSSLWRVPGGLASLARLLLGAGGALRVRYREAAELPALLAHPPAAAREDVEEIPARSITTAAPPAGTADLTPYVQALAVEDGVVVLREGRAAHLTGLGSLLWEELQADGPLGPAELERRIVEGAGEHPDSARLIAEALDALVEAGWAHRG
ncbi:hypothetical protein [Brachybacterium hainanense]|uniref:Serine kinase n=1 Tax=Brachybacterium hainanense TaxID=1541174 RepID=A0ABV6RDU4_9MICO